MGARQFQVVGRGKDVEKAFWREVLKALEVHGDDGYTGTIAEKYEFVVRDAAGLASAGDVARWALELPFCRGEELPSGMPSALSPLVRDIAAVAGDKWGPAVAIELAPHETGDTPGNGDERAFLFFGSAPY